MRGSSFGTKGAMWLEKQGTGHRSKMRSLLCVHRRPIGQSHGSSASVRASERMRLQHWRKGALFHGASVMTVKRLSVIRYLTNAQRPTAEAVRGNQTRVVAMATLNARSALAGANSRHSFSPS